MPRSQAGNDGYVLVELVAAFAIVALVVGLTPPILRAVRASSDLNRTGVSLVSLLRDARTRALAGGRKQSVIYEPSVNEVAGADRSVMIGPELALAFQSGAGCDGAMVVFWPNGANCGALIRLTRGSRALSIDVNAVDGAIQSIYVNDHDE